MILEILKIIILACQVNTGSRHYDAVGKMQHQCQKNMITCFKRENSNKNKRDAMEICLIKRK